MQVELVAGTAGCRREKIKRRRSENKDQRSKIKEDQKNQKRKIKRSSLQVELVARNSWGLGRGEKITQ